MTRLKWLREAPEFGDRHPNTLTSMNNLGTLLETKGDTAAAEPLLREALEGQRSVLGSQHPQTLNSICNLGALLDAKGDLAAAELLLREGLQGQRSVLGNGHADTLVSVGNLRHAVSDQRRNRCC